MILLVVVNQEDDEQQATTLAATHRTVEREIMMIPPMGEQHHHHHHHDDDLHSIRRRILRKRCDVHASRPPLPMPLRCTPSRSVSYNSNKKRILPATSAFWQLAWFVSILLSLPSCPSLFHRDKTTTALLVIPIATAFVMIPQRRHHLHSYSYSHSCLAHSQHRFEPLSHEKMTERSCGGSAVTIQGSSSKCAFAGGGRSRHCRSRIPTVVALAAATTDDNDNESNYSAAPKQRKVMKRKKTQSSAAANSATGSDDEKQWRAILAALQLYKAAFGSINDIPTSFVVPNMKPWPVGAWKLPLGKVLQDMQSNAAKSRLIQNQPQRQQQLIDLGVSLETTAPTTTATSLPTTASPSSSLPKKAAENKKAESPRVEDGPSPPLSARINGMAIPKTASVQEPLSSSPSSQEETQAVDDEKEGSPSSSSSLTGRAATTEIRFRKVFAGLTTYKRLYGNLLVPQPFIVPHDSPEWPPETWGIRLGARVNAIRSQGTFVNQHPERRQALEDLGFAWNPPRTGSRGRRGRPPVTKGGGYEDEDEEYDNEEDDKVIAAAAAAPSTKNVPPPSSEDVMFDELFDFAEFNLDEAGDDGRRNASGGAGAATNADATSRSSTPAWGLPASPQDAALEGLGMGGFGSVEDDLDAPLEYKEPRTLADSMVEATEMAKEVGVIVGMTENKRVIKGSQQENIPWFNDDFGGQDNDFVFEDVMEALTVYKSMHGSFDNLTASAASGTIGSTTNAAEPPPMDPGFVVPAPKERTGFLDEDGVDDDGDGDFMLYGGGSNSALPGKEEVPDAATRAAMAIANFEEQVSNDWMAEGESEQEELATATDAASTRTSSSSPWPEHLAGMALGNIVTRIRDGSLEVRHVPERKAQLDAIGFDWGDDKHFIDVPFEKAMCAMYAYYMIRGDMFVYEDFVMPDEDPWPQALAGYGIGKAVKRIRELQNFLEAFHPEKVSLLRMIDFVWFPTMALPIDPNEPEMDTEMLKLVGMGHPDYAKMIDIPLGLPEKITADGPFCDDGNPKLWFRKWHNWDYVKDYWYEHGRRDNAYVLRRTGYPKMAAEHEAKYGPGLFTQIEETIAEFDQDGKLGTQNVEEKKAIVDKLHHYREELLYCHDILPEQRDKMMDDFEEKILDIMEDSSVAELYNQEEEEEEETEEEDGEYADDGSPDDVYEEGEVEEEYYEYEEEIDVEDELGLDMDR